jgi:hypothetical protein
MSDTADATDRYHLTRFDDCYECEQYLIRSQGRLDVTAFNSSYETTYGNKHTYVVKGKIPPNKDVNGNMFTTVDQEYDLHVGANRIEQVDKDYELTVKGDVRVDLEKTLTAIIKGEVNINLKSLRIEAAEKIILKVGNSFIIIDPCHIYINAPAMIYENSGGSPGKDMGPMTMQNIVDATLAEPGDKWNERLTDCTDSTGSAGTRQVHTVTPTPGTPCTSVTNGVACNFSGATGTASQAASSLGGSTNAAADPPTLPAP